MPSPFVVRMSHSLRRGLSFVPMALIGALLLGLLSTCATPPPQRPGWRELDIDFPEYPPAKPFLRYHQRLQAYIPSPPHPRYTAKSERIFRELERLRMASEAKMEYRNRLRDAANAYKKTPNWDRWETYHTRLERLERAQAAREAAVLNASRERYSERFKGFE